MDASNLRREGFATEAEYLSRLTEIDPDAHPEEFLEPKDYVVDDHSWTTELREKIVDFQFQIDVLTARVAAIGDDTTRLTKSAARWADASAHDQLGAYPWAKLTGAFLITFVVTKALRMLPLGSLASIALPLVLQQSQGKRTSR